MNGGGGVKGESGDSRDNVIRPSVFAGCHEAVVLFLLVLFQSNGFQVLENGPAGWQSVHAQLGGMKEGISDSSLVN